jgi:hypothetical protein
MEYWSSDRDEEQNLAEWLAGNYEAGDGAVAAMAGADGETENAS